MNATSPDRLLGEKSLPRLMAKYTVPCIISLLVATIYNIVDQIFIANAPYLGSFGNAANTVVFPLTVIAPAIAVMIGDGCCAFVSLSLGKNQPEDAGKAVGNAVTLSVVSGLLLCAIYLVLLKPCVLLPRFFKPEGVLYSMPAADLLAFIASVSVIIYNL